LAISLPLRNPDQLAARLRQIYDPASPLFRHYLTPEEFTEMFGPTKEDYESLAAFARNSGLEVTATHPNRTLLDVRGSVADIQKALHLRINRYQHPTENRGFFAPDQEPSLDLAVPVLHIAGLDDFHRPSALSHAIKPRNLGVNGLPMGSGSGGLFLSADLRAAYVPGVTLTGAGQTVGLVQFDSGFYQSDLTNYEAVAGLPDIPVSAVLLDGYSGGPGNANDEVSLDIEMSMAMAPGLSQILVYEGSLSDDILNRIATDNLARQISASWTYGIDSETVQIFQQFASQGQSFFNAAGDGDAWVGAIFTPCDNPYITIVGGTALTTTGPAGSWVSETVWNEGPASPGWAGLGCWGSSGGISTTYGIPSWQAGVSMSANQGSTTMRNVPDVALTATGVEIICGDGLIEGSGGTSCASPLWAAFTALVNQKAVAGGRPTVGFLNPAIYAIGQGLSYGSCFHDTTNGNNTNAASPNLFYAVPGYDLCTGWGTPAGASLIDALALPDPLQILPPAGFNASGGAGGPFNIASQTFALTNAGTSSLSWKLAGLAAWLSSSSTGGTLAPSSAAFVTVRLNSAANSLPVGNYTNILWFTNLNSSSSFGRQFTLSVLSPSAITTQPANQTVVYGQVAAFSVAATGSPPLSYQWWGNGTRLTDGGNIAGSATPRLTVSNASPTVAGSYFVTVSNALLVVTSAVVNLTITLPSVAFTASPATGVVPMTVQFTSPGADSGNNAITSWNWTFGDGLTATARNPLHTYTNSGDFSPGLVVNNNKGLQISGSGPAITAAAVYSPGLLVNGGFETGDFTGWTLSGGDPGDNFVDNGFRSGMTPHSGTWLAALGSSGSDSYLSQTIATKAGAQYALSLWLDSPDGMSPNEFLVSWNGNTLFDETSLPAIGWTNLQFLVSATATSTVLEFGFRDDPRYLGLDDISVVSAQPAIAGFSRSGSNLVLNGVNGQSGWTYNVITSTNLSLPLSRWAPVAAHLMRASGEFTITATNALTRALPQTYYLLKAQ